MRRSLLVASLALLPFAAACNAIFGIEPFVVYDGGAAGGAGGDDVDAGDAGDTADASDAADAPPDAEICMGTFDLEGCSCDTLGDERECWHGFHGPSSACKTAGSQVCGSAVDGRKLWGACTGASMPAPELCYDGVDNDCDGVIDQQCPCAPTRDLCKDKGGAMLNKDAYTFLTDPELPKANETFYLFVVTTKSLNSVGLRVHNACYGHAAQKPCDTPGDGCPGWNVARFELNEKAGSFLVEIMIDDPPGSPCTVPVTASTTLVVNN